LNLQGGLDLDSKKQHIFGVDTQAVLRYLSEEFARILPELATYKRNNRGLEFTIATDEKPWRLIVVWSFQGHRPSKQWQVKIFIKMSKLASGTNLFVHPICEDGGDYITEFRVNSYDKLMLRGDLPEVPSRCNFD
jgi:hypothetical protein